MREIGALVILDSHIVHWATSKDMNNDIGEFELPVAQNKYIELQNLEIE